MSAQQKKTEDEIRQEIIEKYKYNEEDDKDRIDKMVEERKKTYQAINQKHDQGEGRKHYKKMLVDAGIDLKTGKKKEKPNGKTNPVEEKLLLPDADKSYLFATGKIGNRTEMRHLEKVMKTNNQRWEDAIKDNLFTGWKNDNDALITRRGSGLPASRGGVSGIQESENKEMTEKFSKNLPKGFSANKPKN